MKTILFVVFQTIALCCFTNLTEAQEISPQSKMPASNLSIDGMSNVEDGSNHHAMTHDDMGDMADMPDETISDHVMNDHMQHSSGLLGDYPMTRDASGTSWQPDSTPHNGLHFMLDDWHLMAHGRVSLIYDNQGGPRGGHKIFSTSHAMLMGEKPLGDKGLLNLRAIMSLDALMGSNGYPLLFQTGETANGRTALIDRQHPHDLFVELSGSYSYRLSDHTSAFAYAGLPGEPALGPTAYIHRFSALDNPETPITHHWLDSTHVSFGVITGGLVIDNVKIEGSVFRGREPNQYRYDIESPTLDSYSGRITYNPSQNWSFQTSLGYLKSPEQLKPEVNEHRVTVSGTYHLIFDQYQWSTTFAWGRKMNRPGNDLDGFLLESEFLLDDSNVIFARGERVTEDELLDNVAGAKNNPVTVNKASFGYLHDFATINEVKLGIGGLISRYAYPSSLNSVYGNDPTSFILFLRARLD